MFQTLKPKIKETAQLTQTEGTEYALSNPDHERTLYLDSVGYLVAEQFETGQITVEQARLILKDKYHVRVDYRQILDFLAKLNSLELLETSLEELGIAAPTFEAEELEFKPQSRIEVSAEIEKLYEQYTSDLGFFHRLDRRTLLLLIFGALFFIFPWKRKASGPVVLQSYQDVDIRAATTGRIEEVFVREGDFVQVGQKLVRLEGFAHDLSKKVAEIKKVDAELMQLQKGATAEEVEETKRQVDLNRQIASQALTKLNTYQNLRKKGLISAQELEEVRSNYKIKQKELEKALAKLQIVRTGTRPEIISAKQAEKESLLADLKLLEAQDQNSLIKSTLTGVIASPNTQELKGKSILPGDFIVKVANPASVGAMIYIREKNIDGVKENQILKFKVQALPHATFEGKVSRIAPIAEQIGIEHVQVPGRYFRVYADLTTPSPHLRPGMTGSGFVGLNWTLLGFNFFYDTFLNLRMFFVI